MDSICCLLDACTVINLIHIEEDDFLLKKLKKLDIHINDLVFTEIKNNVYVKPRRDFDNKYVDKREWTETKKTIEQKLTFYRGKKNDNQDILNDFGNDYFEKVKDLTNYKKRLNGELYSTGHALYLSRNDYKNVSFYTDDYPAKDDFSDFFQYQQIGQIKDSVDLLILLYRLDENFTDLQLKKLLNNLYSEYVTDVIFLKKKLQNFVNKKVDAEFIRSKKEIALKLSELIRRLDNLEFEKIKEFYFYFATNKVRCKDLYEIIQKYTSVFELNNDSNSDSLLSKIKKVSYNIGKIKILKLEDLMV
ncbi:hypothetical protein [Cellulophaga baltica]|uniref:hypothetical protein n=1 Tax=Cellulophaga baltica TaxID=76594 RepID=UPI00249448CD|nr:hypothetical protein [Cellulophaga baltica]